MLEFRSSGDDLEEGVLLVTLVRYSGYEGRTKPWIWHMVKMAADTAITVAES